MVDNKTAHLALPLPDLSNMQDEDVPRIGQALQKVDGERARGLQLKAAAFNDPPAYAQYRFAETLNPEMKLNIIHAGSGTLWTDLAKSAGLAELGGAKTLKGAQ